MIQGQVFLQAKVIPRLFRSVNYYILEASCTERGGAERKGCTPWTWAGLSLNPGSAAGHLCKPGRSLGISEPSVSSVT